ncbi:MAG: Hsp70 family protein, partial [Planctomycetota bacterium]|nr:Hsp70 family protein [Planctomycetota bacterium]
MKTDVEPASSQSNKEPTDQPSRFVVGIDLGTTNSAVTFVDTNDDSCRLQTFRVAQLVAPGQIEPRETLPSFHYQAAAEEFAADALRMPWNDAGDDQPGHAVGFFARDHGTMVPGRLIVSAKSWLCHTGVDRTAELLPWQGAVDVDRLSPVDAAARYLEHIRLAWDHQHADEPLARQEIVLTLPASFDEVARELTVKAAAAAGLPRVVLIEEPQAAFYAWIEKHSDNWDTLVEPGQKILVCDCGGGTSDFTLIRVRRQGDKVQFHRVAVGDHLILGGDNLDLGLAHHLENRITGGGKLDPRAWSVLVRQCRQVKETLLADDAPERTTVNLPGGGSKLIGGGRQVEVERDEVRELLLEGFFPRVPLDSRPSKLASGFQEFGLPYAPDAAVTKYLAAFLTAHRGVALDDVENTDDHDTARPDIVLFNGGLFASEQIRGRLLDTIGDWFGDKNEPLAGFATPWQPIVLANERLDLAVARGAAYYGMVRRGRGVRIAAGLARTYYIGVESDESAETESSEPQAAAVCLLPAGAEPGHDIDLTQRRFDLRVSSPVEFPLYVSSTRLTDKPGDLVAVDREQMTPLPPMRTVLRKRKKSQTDTVAVNLHARLTEIGTLDLWCGQIDGPRNWRLQFDVRSATQTDMAAHQSDAESQGFVDESTWEECERLIQATFGSDGRDKPEGLAKRLGRAVRLGETGEISRRQWPTSLLRRIWESLMDTQTGRRRSQVHEARWLNLLGFALRPGYGMAMDDWRVAETWRVLQGKLVHGSVMCRAEWWVLWRRIAPGLAAGQQQALADPVLGPIRAMHHQLITGRGRGGDFSAGSHETAEVWRMLGSLELLKVATKIELGNILLDLYDRKKSEPLRPAIAWSLGRIGARMPMHGPLNAVVPVETAAAWLQRFTEFRH